MMFYLNTIFFGILQILVVQSEVYYMVDRLLTGLTAQQKGTTSQWYLNKTSLCTSFFVDHKITQYEVAKEEYPYNLVKCKLQSNKNYYVVRKAVCAVQVLGTQKINSNFIE